MKRIKLIYNSMAGQSRFKYFLDDIIEKFVSSGFEVSLLRVSKKTNLYTFLEDCSDTYGIVVAGGDGTINKVVNVMMKRNIKVPLGIIPAGTSNDFAKHIKMPEDFMQAIDKILACNIQSVDVGLVNDTYFINICSAGLFTNASQKADKTLKSLLGKLAYFLTAIYQYFVFKPFDVKIETPSNIYIEKISLFLAFNGSSVGGMDRFTDGSSIQDGLLDIIVIKDCKFSDVGPLLTKVLTGKHFTDKKVIYLKEKEIKITKLKGKCDEPDVDGDEGPDFPLDIKCIEKGLNMFL